jgi:hypothetical protein
MGDLAVVYAWRLRIASRRKEGRSLSSPLRFASGVWYSRRASVNEF